jgi:hypothetical protein
MADVIILEFENVDPGLYDKVNGMLGLDPAAGTGDWPAGLISHVGAGTDSTITVMEVWASKAEQEAFMASRLGPALGQAGAPDPKRVEWLGLKGHHAG